MKIADEPILKFVINYLWSQMSVKSSEFFLPKLLGEQESTYDPYYVGNWNIGELPDSNDAVCTRGNNAGSCVGNPTLSLNEVVIKGLYNLQPGTEKPIVNNTNVKAALNFCTLPMGAPYVTSQYIAVTGRYLYAQLCKDINDNDQYPIQGTGSFTATIFTGKGEGDIDVIPDPNDNTKLKVVVNRISIEVPPTSDTKLCTAEGAPQNSNICISVKMDSGSDFNFLANQAANYKLVSTMIVKNINDKLADPSALNDLGNMLTKQVNHIFSDPALLALYEKLGVEGE